MTVLAEIPQITPTEIEGTIKENMKVKSLDL